MDRYVKTYDEGVVLPFKPMVPMKITIAAGEGSLAANTVLGLITASKKYGDYQSTNGDGTETPTTILLHAVDATSEDVEAIAMAEGGADEDELVFTKTGDAVDAALREQMRTKGIILRSRTDTVQWPSRSAIGYD